MPERRVIKPPEIVDVDDRLVFIAGPIQGAPNWQSTAIEKIHDIDPTVTVASPRKEYATGEFDYYKQVGWEVHFLRAAGRTGVKAFWMATQTVATPGRSYAQTTRLEFGESLARHQILGERMTVGIEPGFGNERYIRYRLERDAPDVKITDDLEEMCQNAVDLLP